MNRLQRYFEPKTKIGYNSPFMGWNAQLPSLGWGFENLLDQFFAPLAAAKQYESVKQTDEGLEVRLELPGFTQDQIELVADKGILSIKAERDTGYLKRSYQLPDNTRVEEISAQLQNGILTINIPLERGKVVKIPIRTE